MWSSSRVAGAKRGQWFISRGVAQITSVHAIPSVKTSVPSIRHSLELSNKRKALLSRPGLLGIKRGMITWFTDAGVAHAATVVEIDNCEVVAHKTEQVHGYTLVIMGQIDKAKGVDKYRLDLFEKAGVSPKRDIAEFRIRDESGLIPLGVELKADYFAVGQMVDVMAVTKGKGFAGVMKRHGFAGLRASHGVSKAHRSAGATGGNQDPGRVLPGKKMAGRMGGNHCTNFNNEVLHADPKAGILVIKGQIPGPAKSFVKIRDALKLYGKLIDNIRRDQE